MNDEIKVITGKFNIIFKKIKRYKNTILSNVYILDDKYVLRARKISNITITSFRKEIVLLEKIRKILPYKLPSLRKTIYGKKYLISKTKLWTLYTLIKGNIICSWQNTEKATDKENKLLLETLKNIHRITKGKFKSDLANCDFFINAVEKSYKNTKVMLSKEAKIRINLAIKRLKAHKLKTKKDNMCFVHGDFHYGNIVADKKGNIIGLLDLDWCRISDPLEDLAYSMMMLLRNYREKKFKFDKNKFKTMIGWYNLGKKSTSALTALNEHILLFALFDLNLFMDSDEAKNQKLLIKYQISMIENLCTIF